MPTNPPPDLILTPLNGAPRALSEWVTTFHLVFVALDPYGRESQWLLPTAARILLNFQEADCRVAWLATADTAKSRTFLGRWAEEILTFVDPDRAAAKAFGLQRVPALVHVALDGSVIGAAEGWDPMAWRAVTQNLAKMMAWLPPTVPLGNDPAPFAGALVNR